MEEKQNNEKKKVNFKGHLNKETITVAVAGLIVGIALTCIVWLLVNFFSKDVIAKVNGKKITADEIYNRARVSTGLEYTLDAIDKAIIDDMYTLTEKDEEEVKNQADYLLQYYQSYYGYTQDEFLVANGFNTYDEYLDNVRVNTKINKYLYDYLEKKLEDGAVQKYYDENKTEFTSYDTEHILVKITDDVKDKEALALAKEIIAKLDEGKTFDEVVEEYADRITHEELGYQLSTASLEETYLNEMIVLEDGAYSPTPVKTSYGYHIVHKLGTKVEELNDVRPTIIVKLSQDLINNDSNLTNKAIIELREEKNLKIKDKNIKEQYKNYCDKINKINVEEQSEETAQ